MTTKVGRPVGWYYGWNIVAVCVLAGISGNAMAINAFSLFLHDWSAEWHTPISHLQLGLACCGLVASLGSPAMGALADKYPARALLAAGVAGMALFCFGISLVTTYWQYIALYAVLLPISLCFASSIPANAVVSRWFVHRIGLALGLTAFGLGIAGVVMPPVIAAIMPALGWRNVWRLAGATITFIILPLVLIVIRDRPQARDGFQYVPQAATAGSSAVLHGHGHAHGTSGALGWRDILARRNFWLFVIVYVPMLALYGGCGQNLAPIAASRGISLHTAGLMLSLFSFAQLAATLGGGMLSDRLGNRLPLAGLAIATAIGGVTVAFGHGVAELGLGFMLAGLGGGFWPLLAAGVAAEFGAPGTGRAFGLLMFFVPGSILAPFAVAKMQEGSGSYAFTLVVMAGVTLLGGTACLFMRERRRSDGALDHAVDTEAIARSA